MRIISLAFLVLIAIMFPVYPSLAEQTCEHPFGGPIEITTGDAGATFYLDDEWFGENAEDGTTLLYQESNGFWSGRGPGMFQDAQVEENLQRTWICPIIPPCFGGCDDQFELPPDLMIL